MHRSQPIRRPIEPNHSDLPGVAKLVDHVDRAQGHLIILGKHAPQVGVRGQRIADQPRTFGPGPFTLRLERQLNLRLAIEHAMKRRIAYRRPAGEMRHLAMPADLLRKVAHHRFGPLLLIRMNGAGELWRGRQFGHNGGNCCRVECIERVRLENHQISRQDHGIDALVHKLVHRRPNIFVGADRREYQLGADLRRACLGALHADRPVGVNQLIWNIANTDCYVERP